MSKSKAPTHVKDLHPDDKNARRHTPRNIGTIAEALQEVGAARSIVIDEDNRILAGNGTIEAAAEVGITKLHVVEADGETIVAVRRTGLTDEQKRRLALFDNRSAELAEWDPNVLRELADDGADLSGLWTQEELEKLLDVEDAERVEVIKVDRPTEVAWVLVAIPVAEWPKHQAAVESLQNAAVFSTMVLRPKEDGDGQTEKD